MGSTPLLFHDIKCSCDIDKCYLLVRLTLVLLKRVEQGSTRRMIKDLPVVTLVQDIFFCAILQSWVQSRSLILFSKS